MATTVQIRSHHRRPFSLRVPWVMCRSITTKSDRLFRQIVRRLDARRGDEAEVRFPVLAEPLRQILSVIALGHAGGGDLQHLLPGRFQPLLKPCRRHLLAPVDHGKQVPQRVSHPLAVSPVLASGSVSRNFTSRIRWARQNCTNTSHSRMYLRYAPK